MKFFMKKAGSTVAEQLAFIKNKAIGNGSQLTRDLLAKATPEAKSGILALQVQTENKLNVLKGKVDAIKKNYR